MTPKSPGGIEVSERMGLFEMLNVKPDLANFVVDGEVRHAIFHLSVSFRWADLDAPSLLSASAENMDRNSACVHT